MKRYNTVIATSALYIFVYVSMDYLLSCRQLPLIDVHKMTVTNAIGCGQQKGFSETYRGVVQEINLQKKTRIEVAVNDEFVKPTINAIIGSSANRVGNLTPKSYFR